MSWNPNDLELSYTTVALGTGCYNFTLQISLAVWSSKSLQKNYKWCRNRI